MLNLVLYKNKSDVLANEERGNYAYLHLCHLAERTQKGEQRENKKREVERETLLQLMMCKSMH